jgi:hypothetical protein
VPLTAVLWQWLLTMRILQLPALMSFLEGSSTELANNYQLNLVAPVLFFITPRRGPRRQHPVSAVACRGNVYT